MSTKLIRDAVLASAVIVGGFYAMTNREKVYEFVGVHPSDVAKARADRLDQSPTTDKLTTASMVASGSATSISKSPDGHFWTEARVNSSSVKFLVDTGASVVALTPLDAQKAGVDLRNLQYASPINTASGQIMAASVKLDLISVGNVSVRNVRAVVIKKGLPHSLLGMSYLGELQSVEATKGMLILRQ